MDRLSPLDVSFLYFEDRDTPMHVGSVAVFQAPVDGFDYQRLVAVIQDRIAFVPRYRQRVRPIPGRWPTRSGSTMGSSIWITTSGGPRCPNQAPTSSCASWSRG